MGPDGSREQLQFSDLGSGSTSSASKLEETEIPLFAKSHSTVLALIMVDVASVMTLMTLFDVDQHFIILQVGQNQSNQILCRARKDCIQHMLELRFFSNFWLQLTSYLAQCLTGG